MDERVLIVGAGPTGLTLALELCRHGVACRIIEGAPARHTQSRATDIQSRTLEVFHDLGVLEEVLAVGARRNAASLWANGEAMARIPFEGMDTPYCYALGLEQHLTEQILERHLARAGVNVEYGVRLAELGQTPESASATLLYDDGHWDRASFAYVVGCDGARSAVRRCLGLGFEGSTFRESFFLADLQIEYDLPHDEMSMHSSQAGMLGVLPLPNGVVRIFGDIDPGQAIELDLPACQRLLTERMCRDVRASNLGWTSMFNIHTRMVGSYRKGRAFLAGDAAHIHSPAGGHGMNTGIQDAYNLAWKLGLVLRGKARPALLDSYHVERHPVAKALLAETEMETRLALWRSRIGQSVMKTLMTLMTRLPPVRQRFLAGALEISNHYRASPIVSERGGGLLGARIVHSDESEDASILDVREFAAGPRAGDRAPDVLTQQTTLFDVLRGTPHTLLLFDGNAPTPAGYAGLLAVADEVQRRFGDRIKTRFVVPTEAPPAPLAAREREVLLDRHGRLHARYGAGAECAYLIRPDGYIGYRSQPADGDALTSYLDSLFG